MSEDKEKPYFIFNFHGNVGQQIGNVEFMEVHFDKDMNMQVSNLEGMKTVQQSHNNDVAEKKLNPMQQELMPIFMNDREEMLNFVSKIDGATSTSITELVNKLVRDGKILRVRCKKDLWEILNRYGLYQKGLKNWYSQVN